MPPPSVETEISLHHYKGTAATDSASQTRREDVGYGGSGGFVAIPSRAAPARASPPASEEAQYPAP